MKKDRTYKKLGEVCDINYGTRVVQKKDGGSIYPVYGGGGATFRMDTYNREDCLVVARFAMSPKCTRIVKGKFFLNDSGLTLVAHEELYQDYLNWHIISLNDEIYQTAKGAAQKNLDVKAFTSLKIAIPPLSIQRSIVAELDLLRSVILKKKEQLRELDNLAQSLFYQMFGDPIANPMGWEKTYLKDKVQEMFLGPFGSALKVSCYVPQDESYCMVYEQKHAIKGSLNVETHYIDQQKFNELERFNVRGGDFIMSCRGTIGKIYQLPQDAPLGIIHPSLMKIRLKKDSFTPCFFLSLLSKIVANESTNGNCVQMAITAKDLGNKLIIYPPLSLQQSFSAKVSAIEAQKQAITQSIKETEALLAQRMDTYFS